MATLRPGECPSDCEQVAQFMGVAIDDAETTAMVPEVCCEQCHTRQERFPLELQGSQLGVCCGLFKLWHATSHTREETRK